MPHDFEGRRVAAIVGLMVVLTAVLPPAAAYTLAQWRITRAERLAADAAGPLGMRKLELHQIAGAQPVVCGPGRLPRGAGPGVEWLQAPAVAGPSFDASWPQDPWGHCYLLHVGGILEGGGLLISAGPNGTIETPLGATAPAGDDIAAMVR